MMLILDYYAMYNNILTQNINRYQWNDVKRNYTIIYGTFRSFVDEI